MKEVQLVCGKQADNRARGFFSVLTAAVFSVAVLAGNALSQEVDAQIPILVNVDATVKIDPPATEGGTGAQGSVTGGTEQIFDIKLAKPDVSVSHRPQRQTRAGAWISQIRGNVTLNLNSQEYENVVISLHSINGKRILNGKASASKGTANISRANIPAGVYQLSVKGVNGGSFTTRLTHSGNMLNINVAFLGGDNALLNKSIATESTGEWTITVSATGYEGQTRKFSPVAGLNARQSFTLTDTPPITYTLMAKHNLPDYFLPSGILTVSPELQTDLIAGAKVNIRVIADYGDISVDWDEFVGVGNEFNGYAFGGWTVTSGNAVFADANSTNTTVTLSSDATILANFVRVALVSFYRNIQAGSSIVTVELDRSGFGTYIPAGWPKTGSTVTIADTSSFESYIPVGTRVNLSVSTSSPYRFQGWSVFAGYDTDAKNLDSTSMSVTITTHMNIRAQFTGIPTAEDKGTFTDSRDGKSYKWVKIGTQTWMAENLNYDIPDTDIDRCYDNLSSNCNIYGRLYDWATVMGFDTSCNSHEISCADQVLDTHRGLCPAGWHIPSQEEWAVLIDFVGGKQYARDNLRATSRWFSTGGQIIDLDEYGFSALPGGTSRYGSFHDLGVDGYWWSTTEMPRDFPLLHSYTMVLHIAYDAEMYGTKNQYYSVRCLRDDGR